MGILVSCGAQMASLIRSAALLAAALTVSWFASQAAAQVPLSDEPLRPLPALESLKLDPRKIGLGEKLFVDGRLSEDRTVSCSTCHVLANGGMDGFVASVGIRKQIGAINAPTVFNSGLNFRQFWNGRAASLEEQIDGVVGNPKEFDTTWPSILARLSDDAELRKTFDDIYPDGLQAANVKDALATYERSLLTPSRFDRFLQGQEDALTVEEKAGYGKFKSYGCVACHQGINVGGNMFQKFGAVNDYFGKRGGNITEADLGRFKITGRETDRHVFKVPSLRNVALTAPYFHDGTATTLEQAVEVMFLHQLGRSAPQEDKRLIVQFLRSLTGERFGSVP